MSLADHRKEYALAGLAEKDLARDPFRQFEKWFQEAEASKLVEPNAMVLASATRDGRPSARAVLLKAPGLDVVDEPENKKYPMPLHTSERYNCEVGRLRVDCALDNGLCFWVSGDQLLKGAALNAVQIAEELLK